MESNETRSRLRVSDHVSIKIIDRKKSWVTLGKNLSDTGATAVKVGVFDSAEQAGKIRLEMGRPRHADGRFKKKAELETSPVSNAEIAAWHEYGTSRIPKRSFLRSTFDANFVFYRKIAKNLGARVVFLRITRRVALNLLGAKVASDMRAKIRSNIPPALAKGTVEAKGSSVALIDSGQLIRAVRHEVVRK